jgi:hypothetical protein
MMLMGKDWNSGLKIMIIMMIYPIGVPLSGHYCAQTREGHWQHFHSALVVLSRPSVAFI